MSIRYTSSDEDSARWEGFAFRDGDIVISARSKTGTTWVQMICALLVFGTPTPPGALGELSPWLDHLVTPRDEVLDLLDTQRHRRFIKTHTPLDGIPLDSRVTYLVTARHPLDMAVSMYHQGDNIDRQRVRELTGAPREPAVVRPSLHDWLVRWVDRDTTPLETRRPGRLWSPRRTFTHMRAHADSLTPNAGGVLKGSRAFFRRGDSGAGQETLTTEELAHYRERVTAMAAPDLLEWLHR